MCFFFVCLFFGYSLVVTVVSLPLSPGSLSSLLSSTTDLFSLFLWKYHCCRTCLDIWNGVTPSLLLFFRMVLAIHGGLKFQIEFYIIFSSTEKNDAGIFAGIVLNVYITFSSMNIPWCWFCLYTNINWFGILLPCQVHLWVPIVSFLRPFVSPV